MEQHPVPQNISSYEFRLVGDMTLKQFFQLAGGVALGIFFYRLPIIALVRYPLVFLSVVTGILMAFVPLQGRPFTQWIVAFIRAIYSPTEFTWRLPNPPPPTTPTTATNTSTVTPPPAPTVQIKTANHTFLDTLRALVADVFSHKRLTNISDNLPSTPVAPTTLSKPLAEIVTAVPTDHPQKNPPLNTGETFSLKTPDITTQAPAKNPAPQLPPQPTATQTTSSVLSSVPQTANTPKNPPVLPSPQPTATPTATTPPLSGSSTVFEATPAPTSAPLSNIPPQIGSTISDLPITNPVATAPNATTSTAISTPTSPNILSGLVLDTTGKILSGATIEIVDSSTGIPVRALRSNRVGQFQIAIPLPTGLYIINIEKEGHIFDPVSVTVANTIIQPIMIKARAA